MLGNIDGTSDSWAAFWALTVMMKKGYCMAPYESFITNIGFDNTGVHSKDSQPVLKLRSNDKLLEITLPDKIEFVNNYQKSFANYYPWTNPVVKNAYYKETVLNLLEISQKKIGMANYLKERRIQNITIWGRGRITDYIIEALRMEIEIVAITETHLTGREYRGIPLIDWKDLPRNSSLIIVIPGFDIERIKHMLEEIGLADRALPVGRLTEKVLHNEEKIVENERS